MCSAKSQFIIAFVEHNMFNQKNLHIQCFINSRLVELNFSMRKKRLTGLVCTTFIFFRLSIRRLFPVGDKSAAAKEIWNLQAMQPFYYEMTRIAPLSSSSTDTGNRWLDGRRNGSTRVYSFFLIEV